MTGPSLVSTVDRASFDETGFLVVRGMYRADEVAALAALVQRLADTPPSDSPLMLYGEDSLLHPGERVLSRIERFVECAPELASFVTAPRLLDRVAALIDDRPQLFKEKVNFKMPGGDGFRPHQDIQPGWTRYAPYFVSVLVTIDPSTVENGCLELAAGHHRRGMIGREWEPLEGAELEGVAFEAFPMAPGDVAFFDCFVPHRSAPNLTERPRRNLYLTFNRVADGDHRERYFADKRASYPPDDERDPSKSYAFRV